VLAGFQEPVENVMAAVSAGRLGTRGHGQVDLASGIVQFLGNLPTGPASGDYEYGAFGQLVRVAVLVRVKMEDLDAKVCG
jgi:hypothetical protein